MATTIVRTPWIDDDGSGTTGTVLNNAIKTELYNQIDGALAGVGTAAAPGVSTVTTTGSIATLPIPSGAGDLLIMMDNPSPATIHGIAPGINGQRLTIYPLGAGGISLAYISASAGATNQRLVNFAASAATPVAQFGAATYVYDNVASFVWRLVSHEQGAFITAPYSAANFVGTGGMAWTVNSGSISVLKYRLAGRSLTVLIRVENTTIGGTLTNHVLIKPAAFGGYVAANAGIGARCPYQYDTAPKDGYLMAIDQGIEVYRYGGNFEATGTLSIYGEIIFEVS